MRHYLGAIRAMPCLRLTAVPARPLNLLEAVQSRAPAPIALRPFSSLIRSPAHPVVNQACIHAGQLASLRVARAFATTSSNLNKEAVNFQASDRAQAARQINLRAQLSSKDSKQKEFSRLFDLAKREKWSLVLALSLLVISSAVSLTLPAAIGKVMDAVNGETPERTVFGLDLHDFLKLLGGCFVLGAFATFGRIIVLRSIGERMVAKLRVRIFRNIVAQDAEFFDANRTGDLISRLGTDANVVARAVTGNMADGLRALLMSVMGVGMMSYISIYLTGIITVCLPPVMIATWLYGRRVRKISRELQVKLGDLTRVSEERLNNIKTAQSFGGETQEIRIYNRQIRSVFQTALQEAKANGVFYGVMQLTGNTVVIGLLALGANMVSSGAMTFGELSSFIMYTAYAGSSISGMANFYSELMKGAGAASRLFEIEDRKPSIPPFLGKPVANARADIRFENVDFAYPTRPAVQIFRGLDLTIKAGSKVCIVGQSGGGKSTIMALLLRFYEPSKGEIYLGDQPLSETSPWALRQQIGVVSQEPVLFNGTVAENIQYAKPNATRAEVLEAARQANCTFLADFPEGIDTPVGPRGTQLSGGQKQRIAIARAIISKPAILILDEATSALDGESELLVNKALSELIKSSSTTISIAHRLSTIARSKEVIVLGSNGKAIEHGEFQKLYNDPKSELSQLLERRQEVPVPQQRPNNDIEREDEREREQDFDPESEAEPQEQKATFKEF